VIELKDELFFLAGVLATVFVVSKIAAGVQTTILLIQGLVAAYVALRNSAVAAAIASRFALNPLAGLATGAAVVGAIIAAVKLFDNQTAAAAGTGANTVSSASLPEGFTAGTAIKGTSGGGGGGGGGFNISGGGGGGGSNVAISKPSQTLIEQVSEANFIKRTAGTGSFDVAGVRRADERGNVIINVNAPSAIDEEGFTRAVILALNNSTNRGTTGAGDLRTSAQIL